MAFQGHRAIKRATLKAHLAGYVMEGSKETCDSIFVRYSDIRAGRFPEFVLDDSKA